MPAGTADKVLEMITERLNQRDETIDFDVVTTYADVDALGQEIGYRPATRIEQGVAKFIEWYRDYYNYK